MKRIKTLVFILLIAFVLPVIGSSAFSAYAADSYMADKTETVYDDNAGLSTGKANAVCQTEDGFLWIGQYAGLTRYDSENFTTFTEMGGCQVTGVVSLASVGNDLYIGTQKGLFILHNGTVTPFKLNVAADYRVNQIVAEGDLMYFATDRGLYSYSRRTGELRMRSNLDVVSVAAYETMYYYVSHGKVYGSNNEVYFSVEHAGAKSVFLDRTTLYIGFDNGEIAIKDLALSGSAVKTVMVAEHNGINKFVKHEGKIYIATDGGLRIFDGENVEYDDGLAVSASIDDISFDYEGNLWLASSSSGVSKISVNQLVDYFYDFGITAKNVTAIERYEIPGSGKTLTYVATETGLIVVDDGAKQRVNNELTALLEDIRLRDLIVFDDKLYIATYGTALYDLIEYDGAIKHIMADKLVEEGDESSNAGQIRCLAAEGDSLFIGTNYGVSKMTVSGGEKTFVTKRFDSTRPLYIYPYGDKVYVCLDNKGVGVMPLDFSSNFERFDEEFHSSLKCLYSDGKLFFNDNNVLLYYDGESVEAVDCDMVGSIVEILRFGDKFFIGTDVMVYEIKASEIYSEDINPVTIGKTKGLRHSLIANTSGYYDEAKNEYYFATLGGVYIYDIANEEETGVPVKLAVNSIYVDGVPVEGDTLELGKDAQRLTIDVSVLSFAPNDGYTVYYKMSGVDSEYRVLGAGAHEIVYSSVPGGDHDFTVYAESASGKRSANIVEIRVNKALKLYEYVWFWVVAGVLVLGVTTGAATLFAHLRTRRAIARQLEYKKITLESIEAIARTVDAKDSYTNGHSMRVGKYSRMLAIELGLKGDEVDNIYYIALLHDIGKIGIPDAILNKPGRLTDEEFAVMKSHTVKGAGILSSISTIPHIVEGAEFHHEKYNGTGYPMGLKGKDIPYIARIICCCDCYDAMATKRVYKMPYTEDQIIEQFEKGKGTQFDPEIADAVIRLIREGKFRQVDEEFNREAAAKKQNDNEKTESGGQDKIAGEPSENKSADGENDKNNN